MFALALVGCTDDSNPSGTLGSGTLRSAQWSGGLCPQTFTCAGSLLFTASGGIVARDGTGATVARGTLSSTAAGELATHVAAIPLAEPTGLLEYAEALDDGGTAMLEVHRTNEIRIYLSSGLGGDLGNYVGGLRDQIKTCTTDTRIASYDSCTQQQ